MAEYIVNGPVERAGRVQASGQVRGSTPLSQQVSDAVNAVRRQVGLPPNPTTGLAPDATELQQQREQEALGAGPAPEPHVLPMWLADP